LPGGTGDLPLWLAPEGTGFGPGYAVLRDRGAAATPETEGTARRLGAFGTRFWVDAAEELIGVFLMQLRPNPLSRQSPAR